LQKPKNPQEYYARTRDKPGSKFLTLPRQRSNTPLPGHNAQSNAWGMPGGGCLSFNLTGTLVIDFLAFFLVYYIQFISKTFRREANTLSKIKTINFSNDI